MKVFEYEGCAVHYTEHSNCWSACTLDDSIIKDGCKTPGEARTAIAEYNHKVLTAFKLDIPAFVLDDAGHGFVNGKVTSASYTTNWSGKIEAWFVNSDKKKCKLPLKRIYALDKNRELYAQYLAGLDAYQKALNAIRDIVKNMVPLSAADVGIVDIKA